MNSNSNYARGNCQGSNNPTYEPFMLGSSFGVGRSASTPGFVGSCGNPQGSQMNSVQDCMLWPGHSFSVGNAAKLSGGRSGSEDSQLPGFNSTPFPTGESPRVPEKVARMEQTSGASQVQNQPQLYQTIKTIPPSGSGNLKGPAFKIVSASPRAGSRRMGDQSQSWRARSKPQAFIRVPANGQGEARPLSIPCKIGPLGVDPSSLIQPLEPVTFRITAPSYPTTSTNGVRQPMTFSITPEQLYGARQ